MHNTTHTHNHTHDHTQPPQTSGHTMPGWLVAIYDTLAHFLTQGQGPAIRNTIIQLAQIKPGDTVLDVGCGTGSLILDAAKIALPTGSVYGIDPTPQMIATAQRKTTHANLKANFQIGMIESLQFPNNTFDVVLSSMMIHHLPDDLKVRGMAEVHRVLKPGGRLLVMDFNPTQRNLISRLHAQPGETPVDYIRDQFPAVLEQAGFTHIQPLDTRFKAFTFLRATA